MLQARPRWALIWSNLWQSSSVTPPLMQTMLFGTLDQDGVGEPFTPSYATLDVPGRAEAYQTYIGASNKQINLVFDYWRQVIDSGSGYSDDGLDTPTIYSSPWLVLIGRWFELLKLPVYDPNTDISYAPPPVLLQIGKLLIARCILTDGSPQWMGPFDPGEMMPHGVHLELTFTVVRRFPTSPDPYETPEQGVPVWNRFLMFAGNASGY